MPARSDAPDARAVFDGTLRLVEAFVSHNQVGWDDLPRLIHSIHRALSALPSGSGDRPAAQDRRSTLDPRPAVPVEDSVSKNRIVCLDCGESFKSLRRHLAARHNTFPEAYRARWHLPSTYPMVAPAYSAVRSRLAKSLVGRSATG
jgi:predicted transcriptional regulator